MAPSRVVWAKCPQVRLTGWAGRAAVIAIAYLMSLRGWDRDAAFEYVRAQRKIASMRRLGELLPQWRVLGLYQAQLERNA